MTDSTQSLKQAGEPYWVVIFDLGGAYASTVVDAPTNADAEVGAARLIAAAEDTTEFDTARITGPFPSSPGESAVEVRPQGCHGCGLHLWQGDEEPCPHSTWFTRDENRDDAIVWKCIQCETLTVLSEDQMKGGVRSDT